MFLPILHRRLSLGLFGLLFGVMLLFTGCATTSVKEDVDAVLEEPPNEMVAEEAIPDEEVVEKTIVESVNVVGAGDRVLIATTGAVRYTVFRLSDPPRLIVDLPDIELDSIEPRTEVDNYYIRDISAITYGGDERIGRIIIALKDGIDHDVQSSDSSILVMLKEESKSGDEVQEDGWPYAKSLQEEDQPVADLSGVLGTDDTVVEVVEEVVEQEAVSAEAEVSAPAESLAPAKAIVSVEVDSDATSAVVKISADGSIGRYNSFEIENPARIVVDVWGIDNLSGTQRVKGDDKFVKRVRIGRHPEKVRFVFDTRGTEIPPYMVEKEGDTLLLTFGEQENGEVVVAEQPVQEFAQVAPESEPAPVVVEEPAMELVEEVIAEEVEEVVDPVTEPVVEVASLMVEAATEAEPVAEVVEVMAAPVPVVEVVEAEEVLEPEPVAEAKMAPVVKLPVVNVVNFKKLGVGSDAKGRLILKSTEAVELKVQTSEDKMTVIFDIENAEIAGELIRTLDASKLGTPVGTLSSYLENDEPSTVRLLVRLLKKATYNINKSDSRITVDFEPIPVPMKVKEAKAAQEAKAANMDAAATTVGLKPVAKYTGAKIDLDMMEANITDVLRLLAEVSDLNIIASDDVRGTISLRLKNVPWDQAFEIILRSKSLDMVQEGNVVRVAPASKINKEREESLAAFKAQEQLEPLEIEFVPVSYATTDGLITQVKSVLSKRGTVSAETRTNTLIIKDIASGIVAAKSLIAKLDTPIPQVLIEARIVEASTSFARDLGIQWGLEHQTQGNVTTDIFGSSSGVGQTPPSNTVSPAFATRHGSTNYAVNLPASGGPGALGALGFVLGNAGASPLLLDLRLTAGEQEGKLRTISRPRIITMDNKQAEISQGEKIPFSTTSASGTTTTFVDASLKLTVTPHITPDGSVLMKIKATRNSVGAKRSGETGDPSINTKEASTEVLVRDGETTVIGGIVVSDTADNTSGIPFLKNVPVVGWFFKNSAVSDSQTELLIFITPTIMLNKTVG